jgi:sigma-54 dependent transcriptional regulator, acetoin dehydrogenase operon transcriptional activator AcoR
MNQASSFLSLLERCASAREVQHAPGETVFGQGARGDSVFVITSGKVGIFREKGSGREMIAMRGPGHLVGEMALFGQKRRSASLVALEACTLLRVDGEEMLRLLGQEPALGLAISRLLAVRLQELMDLNLEEKNRQLEMSALALEAAHRELQAVVDRSVQGVVSLGSAGQVRYANARAAELLGTAAGEGRDEAALPEALRRLLARGVRVEERISVEGRTLLVEVEPLPSGGRVVFLLPKEEIGRMARALSGLGASFTLEDLLGSSPQIAAVKEFIRKAAQTASSVLIEGETGTGKELVAQAIHNASDRWHRPFVPINCAAIPSELLESELYGHEKGAFTGAVAQQPGKFELAQGGTLFLDEIAEMAPPLQAKLLRVLQERKLFRLGGRRAIALDVRVIAATNRDLDAAVEQGAFRSDLLYRIRVLHLRLPPLRQRASDIPVLARHFVEKLAERQGKRLRQVSSRVLSALAYHSWPGNVRELENVLERAVSLAEPGEEVLRQVDLPAVQPVAEAAPEAIVPLVRLEEQAIRQALRVTGGHVEKTAAGLGISRASLFRKLKTYGIDRKSP